MGRTPSTVLNLVLLVLCCVSLEQDARDDATIASVDAVAPHQLKVLAT